MNMKASGLVDRQMAASGSSLIEPDVLRPSRAAGVQTAGRLREARYRDRLERLWAAIEKASEYAQTESDTPPADDMTSREIGAVKHGDRYVSDQDVTDNDAAGGA